MVSLVKCTTTCFYQNTFITQKFLRTQEESIDRIWNQEVLELFWYLSLNQDKITFFLIS